MRFEYFLSDQRFMQTALTRASVPMKILYHSRKGHKIFQKIAPTQRNSEKFLWFTSIMKIFHPINFLFEGKFGWKAFVPVTSLRIFLKNHAMSIFRDETFIAFFFT